MSWEAAEVYVSTIDEERFGIRVARAPRVKRDTLPLVMDFCNAHGVNMLIARCLVSELKTAQAMQRQGFALMDTLVYYARSLVKTTVPEDIGQVQIRPVHSGDESAVRVVAADAFQGYHGHYHADERLDRAKCDEAYTDWAVRSCLSSEAADEVLVAEIDSGIAGFATLRINSSDEGEGVLFAVASWAQRRGIYRSLMIRGMEWCLSKGLARMVVSTQITNVAVQKVWTRVGFEPSHAYYTFHKWFL